MLPEYDGVAEVWFESHEGMIAAMSTPEGQRLSAALLEDEGNFVDHSKSTAFLVRGIGNRGIGNRVSIIQLLVAQGVLRAWLSILRLAGREPG